MKKKDFIFNWGIIFFFLMGVFACKQNQEIDVPKLRLDQNALNFKAEGGEISILVESNQPSWVAISPEEGKWLDIEKVGNKLTVRAKVNDRPEVRTSYIFISAGGVNQKVSVTQEPSGLSLFLTAEKVEASEKGGTYVVNVLGNDDQWTIESQPTESDWVTVTPNHSAKLITLIVQPNWGEEGRETVVMVYSKDRSRTFELYIRQIGQAMKGFSLPYLEKVLDYEPALIDYEKSHGSYLLERGPNGKGRTYRFLTRGRFVFERIYEVNDRNRIMRIMERPYNNRVLSSAYVDFLMANDFKEVFKSDNKWVGRDENRGFEVTLSSEGYEKITYKRVISTVQKGEYPTWEIFPEDLLFKYVGDTTMRFHNVLSAELASGATISTLIVSPHGDESYPETPGIEFSMPADQKPHVSNRYQFVWEGENAFSWELDKDTIERGLGATVRKITVFDNINLVYWENEDTGELRPTEEFKSLMERSGWHLLTDHNYNRDRMLYRYRKGKREIYISVGGYWPLRINAYNIDGNKGFDM